MFEKEIYDRLREIFVLLAFNTQEVLRQYNLTIEQYDTLLTLEMDVGWRMGALTRKIISDNSKMTRIVDYLESQGWAERRPDPTDRRAQQVFITPTGAALRDEVKMTHNAALQIWLKSVSESEKNQMNRLLGQIRDNLNDRFG